ncbi:MAG: AI-2E family transporter, partial [Planctomycetes bacterium]|nr:AI-2E family transporter [Planctomycetota bacterium]
MVIGDEHFDSGHGRRACQWGRVPVNWRPHGRRLAAFRDRLPVMKTGPIGESRLPPTARLVSFGVLVGLVVLFGLLSLRVMATFLLPLLLAAMLVVIFGPLHRRLRSHFGLSDWLAAAITTVVVMVIVLVPLGLLVTRAGADAVAMARSPEGAKLDPAVLDGLVARCNEVTGMHVTADGVNTELRSLVEKWVGPLAARAPAVIGRLLIGVVVMVVGFFYFLADGPRMLAAVMRLVPLDVRYQWQLLREFEEVSRAVVSAT